MRLYNVFARKTISRPATCSAQIRDVVLCEINYQQKKERVIKQNALNQKKRVNIIKINKKYVNYVLDTNVIIVAITNHTYR